MDQDELNDLPFDLKPDREISLDDQLPFVDLEPLIDDAVQHNTLESW